MLTENYCPSTKFLLLCFRGAKRDGCWTAYWAGFLYIINAGIFFSKSNTKWINSGISFEIKLQLALNILFPLCKRLWRTAIYIQRPKDGHSKLSWCFLWKGWKGKRDFLSSLACSFSSPVFLGKCRNSAVIDLGHVSDYPSLLCRTHGHYGHS